MTEVHCNQRFTKLKGKNPMNLSHICYKVLLVHFFDQNFFISPFESKFEFVLFRSLTITEFPFRTVPNVHLTTSQFFRIESSSHPRNSSSSLSW